ncbi:MAG: LamG-like jellyroll fold domain-containing protein [Salibacteraceae bacterium]
MKNIILTSILTLFVLIGFAQGAEKTLDFNGTGSYVTCGSVNLSGTGLTFMGWVKFNQFNSSTGGAAANISSLWGIESGGTTTLMRAGDGGALAKEKIQLVVRTGATNNKLNGNKSLTTGQWYHLAGTYDGSTMKIYINGILDVSKSVSGNVSASGPFQLGYNYNTSRFFDGEMENVTVWKTALTQSTIREWMCKTITTSHPNYANLEAHWKFDNGTGATVTDHSGNSHNGTKTTSTNWITSSAPIGDVSVTDFTAPYSLSLNHPDGDSLTVTNVTGSPSSVHLYRVNEKPNITAMPNNTPSYDTTRYWGVFYAEGSAPKGDVNYYYANNTNYIGTGSCMIAMASRTDNSSTTWTNANMSQSLTALTKTSHARSEYILYYASNKFIHKDSAKTVCDGDSVILQHSTSGMNYTWFRNNVAIAGAIGNSYKATQAGTYQLTANVGTCTDTSETFTLSTNPLPIVTLAPLSSVCPDVFLDTLKGGLPAGGVYKHTYVSGNFFVVKTAGPGLHTITYEYVDPIGCAGSASQVKEVFNWPAVSLSSIPSMCEDSTTFTLTNGVPSGGTYQINGVVNSSFDASSLGSGNQQVKYIYTDSNSCTNSDSITLTLKKLPTVSLALIEKTRCEYGNSIFMSGANPFGGSYSGTAVTGTTFDPKVAGPGKHAIIYSYTDKNNQCTNVGIDTITVYARPSTPVITNNTDSLVSTPADKYLWYSMAGRLPSDTSQSLIPTESGDYYIIVQENGCNSFRSDTVTFEVKDIENTIRELNNKFIKVYPIPANNELNFEFENISDVYQVKILDLKGSEVLNTELKNTTQIDVSEITNGNYIIELSSGIRTLRKHIIIQH